MGIDRALVWLLCGWVSGCTFNPAPAAPKPDASLGSIDAAGSSVDGDVSDAGVPPDARLIMDAEPALDMGVPDAGFVDAGTHDVGFPDAGVAPDVGIADSGIKPDAGVPAWLLGYGFRRFLTVNGAQVSGTVTQFPVLVHLVAPELRLANLSGFMEQPDARDVRFTAADGVTPLPHQIERYDGDVGAIWAWVQMPALTVGVDASLYMYYGHANPAAVSSTMVWDSDYVGVWHFAENPAFGPILDSTNRFIDLTPNNLASDDWQDAWIGHGVRFPNADSDLSSSRAELNTTQNLTIAAWGRLDGPVAGQQDWPRIYHRGAQGVRLVDFYVRDDINVFGIRLNADGFEEQIHVTHAFNLQYGVWHHYAAVVDDAGNRVRLYLDGDLVQSENFEGRISSYREHHFGNWDDNGADARNFNGLLDEVRFSNVPRSNDWIRTSYRNQNAPNTFITAGPHEAP